MIEVKSSNIAKVGWDGNLHVVFKDGSAYRYENVPVGLYDEMLKSESIGRFFVKNIKPNFKCEKLFPFPTE